MPIELIDKIKPKNNGSFALVDAEDVQVAGERLNVTVGNLQTKVMNLQASDIHIDENATLGDLLTANPTIAYREGVTTRPLYSYAAGATVLLEFVTSTSLFGPNSITVDRAIHGSNSFVRILELTSRAAEPAINVGVAAATGDYDYRVRVTDPLGNVAKVAETNLEYLEFRVIMGSIKLEDSFSSNINNTLLSTDTTEIKYDFDITANAQCDIKLQYQIGNSLTEEWSTAKLVVENELRDTISVLAGIKTSLTGMLQSAFAQTGNYKLYTRIEYTINDEGNVTVIHSGNIVNDLSIMEPQSVTLRVTTAESEYATITNKTPLSLEFITLTNDSHYQINPMTFSYILKKASGETILGNSNISIFHNDPIRILLGKLSDVGDYILTATVNKPSTPPKEATETVNIEVEEAVGEGTILVTDDLMFSFSLDHPDNYSSTEWVPDAQRSMNEFKIINNNMLADYVSNDGGMLYSPTSFGYLLRSSDGGTSYSLYNPFFIFSSQDQNKASGLTIETYFRSKCIGEVAAKVISARPDNSSATYGLSVSYDNAIFSSSNYYSKYPLIEDRWHHLALVIDGDNQRTQVDSNIAFENINPYYTARIYVDGVLSNIERLSNLPNITQSELGTLFPMILNGQSVTNIFDANTKLEISDQGTCEIKALRCYSRGLTSSEVYNNYLYCLDDAEREKIIAKNATGLPKIVFVRNLNVNDYDAAFFTKKALRSTEFVNLHKITEKKRPKGADGFYSKDTLVNCTMYYSNTGEDTFTAINNVDVYLQGTSSLVYPVKNYQIKTYTSKQAEDGTLERTKNPIYPPTKDADSGWIQDSIFTLKCDYMEQSHRNNTPTACYYEDSVLDGVISTLHPGEDIKKYYSTPKQLKDSLYRDAIDGFPCLVYYYDNDPQEEITNADQVLQKLSDFTLAGTFMFNVDKEGEQLGFTIQNDQGESYECVSYEGSANSDYGAAAFLSFDNYNNERLKQYSSAIVDYSWKTTTESNDALEVLLEDNHLKTSDGLYFNVTIVNDNPRLVLEASASSSWYLDPDNKLVYTTDITQEKSPRYGIALDSNNFDDARVFLVGDEDLKYLRLEGNQLITEKEDSEYIYLTSTNGGSTDLTYYESNWKYIEATLEPRKVVGVDEDNAELVYNKIANTIEWVDAADDVEFKTNFTKYFSYEYCMTYFLQMMVFAQVDNAGKNAMFDYWAIGQGDNRVESVLYPRPYDMDTQMGEENTGHDIVPSSAEINPRFSPSNVSGTLVGNDSPQKYVENYNTTTSPNHNRYQHYNTKNSRLWEKFARLFRDDIIKCYAALRGNVYTVSEIMNAINAKTFDVIGEKFYNSDAVSKYINIKTTSNGAEVYNEERLYAVQGNRVSRYEQYLTERLIFLDTYFGVTLGLNQLATFRAYETKLHPIGIRVYSPQYLKIVIGTTQQIMTAYADPADTYELDGEVYKGTLFHFNIESGNKEIIIQGVGNIQVLDHFNAMKCGSYTIQNMTKLTELDLANNTNVTELTLGNNSYFRTLNLQGTTNLKSPINLTACNNLVRVNLSRSGVPSIQLPENTALEELNLSNSKITSLTVNGSATLNVNGETPTLNLTGCTELTELELSNCPQIESLDLSVFPKLSKVRLLNNENLKSVNLNKLILTELIISNNTALTTLSMNQLKYSPAAGTLLDLQNVSTLKALNLNNATIPNINIPKVSYDSFDVRYANIQNINRTNDDDDGTYNFDGCTFNTISKAHFYDNTAVKHIKNLTLEASNNKSFASKFIRNKSVIDFTNCCFKTTHPSSSIASMFNSCSRLQDITTSKFEGFATYVTEAIGVFTSSIDITLPSIRYLLENLASCESLASFLYSSYKVRKDVYDQLSEEDKEELYPTTFPLDLLIHNTKVTSLNRAFDHTAFEVIPYDENKSIISHMNNLSDVTRLFCQCNTLKYVPDNIFKWNTKLTTTRSAFLNCKELGNTSDKHCILSSTYDILPYCVNDQETRTSCLVTDISGMFAGCCRIGLYRDYDSSDDENYTVEKYEESFKSLFSYATGLTHIDGLFFKCYLLRPPLCEGLFKHNINLKHAEFTFLGSIINFEHNLPDLALQMSPEYNAIITRLTTPVDLPEIFKTDENASKLNMLTHCGGMFAGNTALTGSIDATFFASTPNIQSIGFTYKDPQYYVTTDANGTITARVGYDYVTTITAPGMFADTNIGSFDAKCLNELSALQDTSLLFVKTKLTETKFNIGTSYYLSFKLPAYATFRDPTNSYTFQISEELNSLQISNIDNVFDECKDSIINTSYMFTGCSMLEAINAVAIFQNCKNLQNIENMFANCINLSDILNNAERTNDKFYLFDNLTQLTNVSGLFLNCTSLDNTIDDIELFKGCTHIQNCNRMFMNTAISGTISNKMFDSCRATLSDTSYMFANCNSLDGVIQTGYATPVDWDPNTSAFIYEVQEYGLLSNCTKLHNVSYMFCNCSNLTGPIPADMFYSDRGEYTNLTSLESLFENCDKLGLDNYSLENAGKSDSKKTFENTNTVEARFGDELPLYSRNNEGARTYSEIYPKVRFTPVISNSPTIGTITENDVSYWTIDNENTYIVAREGIETPAITVSPTITEFENYKVSYWVIDGQITSIEVDPEKFEPEYQVDAHKYFIPDNWLKSCTKVANIDKLFCHVGAVTIGEDRDTQVKSKLIPLLTLPSTAFTQRLTSARHTFILCPLLGRTTLGKDFMSQSLNYLTDIRGIFTGTKIYRLGNAENNTFLYKASSNTKLKSVAYAFAELNYNGYKISTEDDNVSFANTWFTDDGLMEDNIYIHSSRQLDTEHYGPKLGDTTKFRALSEKEADIEYAFSLAYNVQPVYKGQSLNNDLGWGALISVPQGKTNYAEAEYNSVKDATSTHLSKWLASINKLHPAF